MWNTDGGSGWQPVRWRSGRMRSTPSIRRYIEQRYSASDARVKRWSTRHAVRRVAEGEGFEPSRRLNTPYSLSRRALSAAQSSLRWSRASVRGGAGTFEGMDPVDALDRIATLLERERAGRYKEAGVPQAADAIRDRPRRRAARARRRRAASQILPGIGSSTGQVDRAGARGRGAGVPGPPRGRGRARRRARRADPRRARRATCTCTPTGPTAAPRSRQMARKAAELGHDYLALTDHSPRLTVAHGLDAGAAARAARGRRARSTRSSRRSASSPASRSTSSTTAASTRTTTCSPSSTSSSRACTRSSA